MQKYQVNKSTMERYDIHLKGDNAMRCQWANISISGDGMFNVQSDCGDFNYYWGSFGTCFKSFLADICSKDSSYLYSKIHSREREGKIDIEKTINNMKKRVIESRKEHVITDNEARCLWDELDSIENNYSEISVDAFSSLFYYELSRDERNKVFCDEELWYGDLLVTTPDRKAKTFCEVVAPVFAEILKKELKKEKIDIKRNKGVKYMTVKKGDVVIKKERYSCDIRIVEDADETGILLVNGVKDKFYESDEFDLFNEEYELLVRKEKRLDSFI